MTNTVTFDLKQPMVMRVRVGTAEQRVEISDVTFTARPEGETDPDLAFATSACRALIKADGSPVEYGDLAGFYIVKGFEDAAREASTRAGIAA